MKIEVDDKTPEMYTLTCTAYSNQTDISITLTLNKKKNKKKNVYTVGLSLTTLTEISAMLRTECGTYTKRSGQELYF